MRLPTLFFAFSVLLLMSVVADARSRLLIGIQCYHKGCEIKELEDILTEAYARIGQDVAFRYLPPKRMNEEARRQHIDAYGLITEAEARTIPGLVVVPFPIGSVSLVAFTTSRERSIDSLEDLRGLTVGTVRGSILLQEETLRGLDINRHRFNEARSAFTMLKEGRLDVILGGATAGTLLTSEMGIKVFASRPLMTAELYHAVAEINSDYAPMLANAFRGMVDDGTMARLLGRFEQMRPEKQP